jgi:hypothetical protein
MSDHFTQETSSDKTHREISPRKRRASNGRKLHAELFSREIPCRTWPRNGKENGKGMHNMQTAFYRQTRRALNGTIAQYQIRIDDETIHELCS